MTEQQIFRNCILTIDGIDCSATVEENTIVGYGLDSKCKLVENKAIIRKYTLRKPFPHFIDGIFEIEQDYKFNRRCYMSDDRMRLIEA